jgi:hypothetical protein
VIQHHVALVAAPEMLMKKTPFNVSILVPFVRQFGEAGRAGQFCPGAWLQIAAKEIGKCADGSP